MRSRRSCTRRDDDVPNASRGQHEGTMLNRLRLWGRSILPRRLEQEMQEEMAEHLERAMARLMTRGLSARRDA